MGQSWQGMVVLLLASTLRACSVMSRPTPPPAGVAVEQPWGSVALLPSASSGTSFSDSLVTSLRKRFEQERVENEAEIPYRAMTISGGGSRGAYGARAPASTEELLKLIADPASTFDRNELPAWLHREKRR